MPNISHFRLELKDVEIMTFILICNFCISGVPIPRSLTTTGKHNLPALSPCKVNLVQSKEPPPFGTKEQEAQKEQESK